MSDSGEADKDAWKKYFSEDDIKRWILGEISLQEMHHVPHDMMQHMATTGYNLFEAGRYADARVVFEGLASLNPKVAYFFSALGAINMLENRLQEAEVCLSRAIDLDPKDQSAWVNRGETRIRAGDLAGAGQDLAKAVSMDKQGNMPFTGRAAAIAKAVTEALKFIEQNGNLTEEKKLSEASKDNSSKRPAQGKPSKKR